MIVKKGIFLCMDSMLRKEEVNLNEFIFKTLHTLILFISIIYLLC